MLPDTGSFLILQTTSNTSTAVAISPQVAHLQWKHSLMARSATKIKNVWTLQTEIDDIGVDLDTT